MFSLYSLRNTEKTDLNNEIKKYQKLVNNEKNKRRRSTQRVLLDSAELKLQEYNENIAKLNFYKQKTDWTLKGEKPNSHFLNMIKQNSAARHIVKLKVADPDEPDLTKKKVYLFTRSN